jgi:hypothetical protein
MDEKGTRKALVLSLSVVYLFVAFTYIFFLPKFSSKFINVRGNAGFFIRQAPVAQGVNYNLNKSALLLQPVYKGLPETKHNPLPGILPLVTLFSQLIISVYVLRYLRKRSVRPANLFHSPQYSYLYLRSLRI